MLMIESINWICWNEGEGEIALENYRIDFWHQFRRFILGTSIKDRPRSVPFLNTVKPISRLVNWQIVRIWYEAAAVLPQLVFVTVITIVNGIIPDRSSEEIAIGSRTDACKSMRSLFVNACQTLVLRQSLFRANVVFLLISGQRRNGHVGEGSRCEQFQNVHGLSWSIYDQGSRINRDVQSVQGAGRYCHGSCRKWRHYCGGRRLVVIYDRYT